jgi:hypothetical protein
MEMNFVRPLAIAASVAILAVELMPSEHHEKEHVERIPIMGVVSAAPMSNVAASQLVSYGVTVPDASGLVLPESARHHLYVTVG